ncbi:MAG: TolC family protein, partial [Candidatus Omnitrophica bacterium]|nr:TolC family protein [Candidatus Omnitrophota bacterium]
MLGHQRKPIFFRVPVALGITALLTVGGCGRVHLPSARILPAATPEGLAWRRAVELALAHHPDLRQSAEALAAKRHNRNQALGDYLPSVDGSVSRKRTRTVTSTTTH